MLVNADFRALEWLGVVFLSKDQVGYREIHASIDQHTENQKAFALPSRLIAKTFVFRLVYGGSAFAYANDADFESVGGDQKFWQEVIDKFYSKYRGIHAWHNSLMEQAMLTGKVVIPTGRVFTFQPETKNPSLGSVWPRTTILNYPVQGFGADLMVIARLLCSKRVRRLNHGRKDPILPVGTVHDSVVYDCPNDAVNDLVNAIFEAWQEIPKEFERWFQVELDLPCKVEIQVGHDWHNMEEVKNV